MSKDLYLKNMKLIEDVVCKTEKEEKTSGFRLAGTKFEKEIKEKIELDELEARLKEVLDFKNDADYMNYITKFNTPYTWDRERFMRD